MKAKLACLSLAALVSASCDKGGKEAGSNDPSPPKPPLANRAHAPTIAEKTAPGRSDSPAADIRNTSAPATGNPVAAAMIRPTGISAEDASWEPLTAEQKIEKFNSIGIARIPSYVSDKILADATTAGAPEDQVSYITQQAAAWNRINKFREGESDIPDHMKLALLETLSRKHGESWKDIVPELDEQVAASAKVSELRANGIPGMTADESQDFFIDAIGKYGADYKTILALANKKAAEMAPQNPSSSMDH